MKLIKCPRCELNYMFENEVMCSVCRKDVQGEQEIDDMIELCSECGENPVIPGQEVCAFCLKEIQRRADNSVEDDGSDPSSHDLDIDSVSSMEEIEMDVGDGDEDFSDDDDMFKDDEDEEDEQDEDEEDEEDENDEV